MLVSKKLFESRVLLTVELVAIAMELFEDLIWSLCMWSLEVEMSGIALQI